MTKSGLIIDVESGSPAIPTWNGKRLTAISLPIGTHVVYPFLASPSTRHIQNKIDESLESPIESKPLAEILKTVKRLTIAVFPNNPLPIGKLSDDPRHYVTESVLELAASAGIDDVEIVIARGLEGRVTDSGLKAMLGNRVFDSFNPRGLLNQHDATATAELNERITSSDLIVTIEVTADGQQNLANQIGNARAIYNNTLTSADDLPVFPITVNLDGYAAPTGMEFLSIRRRSWSVLDNVIFRSLLTASDVLPHNFRRNSIPHLPVNTPEVSITSGNKSQGTEHKVTMTGRSHIVSVATTETNLFLALDNALRTASGIVEDGGVVIVHNPLSPHFNTTHFPSYREFFDVALASATEVEELDSQYFEKFANDDWYLSLYREANGVHPIHPFIKWRSIKGRITNLQRVIVVGGHRAVAERLGFSAASSTQDAIQFAHDTVGTNQTVTTHLVTGAQVAIQNEVTS